jgi:DNA-binding NtrC family response regulator
MSDRPLLLVADDEPSVLAVVERFARLEGFDVVVRPGGQVVVDDIQGLNPDLLLVDVQMPDVSGLDVLRAIRVAGSECRVVLMTGHADVDTAVEAIKAGAQDFLSKPLDFTRLAGLLRSVREEADRRHRLLALDADAAEGMTVHGMIGRSPVMEDLFSLIRRVAPHARTVLVTGETGSGKELVALALHARGPRAARRLVTVNCSAIVPTLFESELFGHVRGAFTGATDTKVGLFDHANGATVFLDEVGELPVAVQAKLLRVLENGEYQRVGSFEVRKTDVHIVAATNRDLEAEVRAGRFREDLFYRLNVLHLHVPPLRERREDIPYLVASFVREISARLAKRITGITPPAERALMTAPWTGNVRELRNAIERACVLSDGGALTEREIPVCGPSMASPAVDPAAFAPASAVRGAGPPPRLRAAERELVSRALDEAGGNKKAAAASLGISRHAFYRRLERHGLGASVQHRAQQGRPPGPLIAFPAERSAPVPDPSAGKGS